MGDKGTFFVDLDGTIIHTRTDEALPYAVEKINKAYDEGYIIVITTYRGENWPKSSRYTVEKTEKLLNDIGLKWHKIVWDSPSPRIIMNDEKVVAIQHLQNQSWENFNFKRNIFNVGP